MILNISGRTDIVNYYSKWFMKRLKDGFVYSRNPYYPEHVYKIDLTPKKIDGLIFCSKNYEPMLKYMDKINTSYNIMAHYTITSYSEDIEPNVVSIDKSIETLKKISKIIGREKIVWRFDPILLSTDYTIEKHMKNFEYILSEIHENISFAVFSFVDMYEKLYRNMPEIIPFKKRDIEKILISMSNISKKYNTVLQNCSDSYNFEKYGILSKGCVTKEIFEKSNNIELKDNIRHTGNREGCKCMPIRDIGAYSTCPNACKYCYANTNPKKAIENYKKHDVNSPILFGKIRENDNIIEFKEKSLLKYDNAQKRLF
ncbi:DUF1848 domain-containing protein [uncultured Methanobrevibacter sp.]|uniref:DUF1848 domain-containing protein n=1 Tax=uncultured Methanobrevibacter sp. TaxID=253161 RepID=UPI0025EB7582|nr:DUF1848 domain-containing protein [uncultured Methanobrevibacter sp.]